MSKGEPPPGEPRPGDQPPHQPAGGQPPEGPQPGAPQPGVPDPGAPPPYGEPPSYETHPGGPPPYRAHPGEPPPYETHPGGPPPYETQPGGPPSYGTQSGGPHPSGEAPLYEAQPGGPPPHEAQPSGEAPPYEAQPGGPGTQPGFLPPPGQAQPGEWPGEWGRPDPSRAGLPAAVLVMTGAAIAAAAGLLLSAFLPWVSAKVVISGLGQTLERDLGSESGVNVDGTAQLIPVLALIAIVMAVWGTFAQNNRVAMLAAAPGGLALLCCAIFLLRLGSAEDEVAGGESGLGYEITLAYGWFIALATSLLVVGASLAIPMMARAARPPAPAPQEGAAQS